MSHKVTKTKFVVALLFCVGWLALIDFTINERSGYFEKLKLHKELSNERFVRTEQSDKQQVQEFLSLEKLDELRRDMPNAPVDFWYQNYHKRRATKTYCVQYPSMFELRIYNRHWQTFENRDTLMQLYAAYYDSRAGVENGPVVRVLVMANKLEEDFPRTYCHLWFDNATAPAVVPVTEFKAIWLKGWGGADGLLYPHLLTCHLAERHRSMVPQAVSIANAACSQASNNLRVHYSHLREAEEKHEFGVCVKNMNFPQTDISGRLIEWLELMRLLGAHKVFVYVQDVHHKVNEVLDLYQQMGYVEVFRINEVPIPQEGNELHLKRAYKRVNEVVNYNDCFYRNMQNYEFLAGVDIDEVIMPLGDLKTWHDIVVRFRETKQNCTRGYVDLCFRNVYFPVDEEQPETLNESEQSGDQYRYEEGDEDDTLQNFHFLKNVVRFPEHSAKDLATKCFHNTSAALTIHNHYSLAWLKNSCRPISLSPDLAQMQHYRKSGGPHEALVKDLSIWRYKEMLIVRTKEARERLKKRTARTVSGP